MNDTLTGGANVDTFVYKADGGADTITDLTFVNKTGAVNAGDDRIDLRSFGFDDYLTDVHTLMTQVGSNVVINFGSGDSLQINSTTIAILDMHAADFMLV